MPEPEQSKSTEDIYDRDIDDPYFSTDEHVSVKEKAKFILFFPVVAVITKVWQCNYISYYDVALKFENIYGLASNYYFDPIINCTFCSLWWLMAWYGFCPATVSFRCLIAMGTVQQSLRNATDTRTSRGPLDNTFHGGGANEIADDNYMEYVTLMIYAAASLGKWIPEQYGDLSSYGMYCCGRAAKTRVIRQQNLLIWIQVIFIISCIRNWCTGEQTSQIWLMRQIIVPFVIFASKRTIVLCNIVCGYHDNPFKGHALQLHFVLELQGLNVMITFGCVGSNSYNQAASYIIIDWGIFLHRIGMVMRFGMKTCPKLVTLMVTRALSDLPAPLINHEKSAGSQTAMRTLQAYMCLMEGESMSNCYVIWIFFFSFRWSIMRDFNMLVMFPMRSFFIIVIFTLLDCVQDIAAERITSKFNKWTYLYSNQNNGVFSKKIFIFPFLLAVQLGSAFYHYASAPKLLTHRSSKLPLVYEIYGSPAGISHY